MGLTNLASIEMELVALQYGKSFLRDRILIQIRCKFSCIRDARCPLYVHQQIEIVTPLRRLYCTGSLGSHYKRLTTIP